MGVCYTGTTMVFATPIPLKAACLPGRIMSVARGAWPWRRQA